MKSIPRDIYWQPAPSVAGRYRPWLTDRGSFTARIGNRPLGAALFADPRVHRYPLRSRKLGWHHELHRRVSASVRDAPPSLWARRSLFRLHDSPILVTEVFLPEILRL